MSPQNNPGAVAALNGARAVLAHFDKPRSAEDLAADIIDLWTGAETALQALVGNASLTGQQLIRAARQAEQITLEQAHSLLEFLAARDRANRTSYKPTQADGDAAVDGFKALESAVTGGVATSASRAPAAAAPGPPVYTPRQSRPSQPPPRPVPPQPASPYAPPSAGGGYRQPPAYSSRPTAGPPTIEMPGAFMSEGTSGNTPASGGIGRSHVEQALAAAESRSRFPRLSTPVWIAIAAVIILGVGGYFLFGRGSGGDSLNAGIDALKNGQNERARGEFAKSVNANPKDPTPHVFLARIARTESDLATARAQLDSALRLDPTNAIALREMGLVLFSSKQYDLARKFFVRAVTANGEDRASQGYLGCALMRLGRVSEGTKWIGKAGTGPWQACMQSTAATTAPPPL